MNPIEKLYIENKLITRDETTTFLGVKLDSKLSWGPHIQYIKTKISKNIGIIAKARRCLNLSTLKTLYYSFIYPYLSYCIEVWGSAAKKYISSVLQLQKLCCRIITSSPKCTSSEKLFNFLKLFPVNNIYEYRVMLLMYKFHTGHLPSMFKNIFRKKTQLGVITRQSDHLYIKTCKTQVAFNSIRSKGAILWNSLCNQFDFPCSPHLFKKILRNLLMT